MQFTHWPAALFMWLHKALGSISCQINNFTWHVSVCLLGMCNTLIAFERHFTICCYISTLVNSWILMSPVSICTLLEVLQKEVRTSRKRLQNEQWLMERPLFRIICTVFLLTSEVKYLLNNIYDIHSGWYLKKNVQLLHSICNYTKLQTHCLLTNNY